MVRARKRVGVLGGMGPAATVRFYERLTELTDAARDQDHLHVIVDSAAQTPDRSECIAAGDTAPLLAALRESARRLEAAGAELLVLPCNTAHVVFDELAGSVSAPLLHIVDETAAALAAGGWRHPALLATRGTIDSALYQERCREPPVLVPEGRLAGRVHTAIDRIKAGRTKEAKRLLAETIHELTAKDADALVVACTDLATVLRPADSPLPLVDSSEILARATLREAGRAESRLAARGLSGPGASSTTSS